MEKEKIKIGNDVKSLVKDWNFNYEKEEKGYVKIENLKGIFKKVDGSIKTSSGVRYTKL
jgi:hypothetical protein